MDTAGQDQGVTPKTEDAEMADKPASIAGKKQGVQVPLSGHKPPPKGQLAAPVERVRTGVPGRTVRRG